jgi:serine/threonine protein kinase
MATTETTPAAEPIGTHIGPYRVIKVLGAGGMGRVYLAASRSGRAVAVKVVRPELAGNPDFRRRFKAEADAARAVSGAFTAPVVDADPDGPLPWLATAYIAGPSLQEAIDTHGPMPEYSVRVLAAGIAEALAAIHRTGLVHRDLKPSNILLAADGPRVIDFGISKAVDGTAYSAEDQVIGSAGYMSPEHAAGKTLTPVSDVFSVGAVLAFAATGRPPFGTGPAHVRVYRASKEPPLLAGVPEALLPVIAACLDKDPKRRPAVADLPRYFQPGAAPGHWLGPVAQEVREHERTLAATMRSSFLRRRSVLTGAVVGLGAVSAGAAYLLLDSSSSAAPPRLAWSADLPRASMTPAAFDDATVVCTDATGSISFDRGTGRQLWTDAGSSNAAETASDSDGGRVYAARTDGRLHTIDSRTGTEEWTANPVSGKPPVPQCATPDIVVVTDADARVYGLSQADGHTVWTYNAPALVISVQARSAAGQLVMWGDGATALSANFLDLYTVLSVAKGERLWSKPFLDLLAPPTGDVFYALDDSMNLVALTAATGEARWTHGTTLTAPQASGLTYGASLHLEEGILFCSPRTSDLGDATATSSLTAFDPATGGVRWSIKTGNGVSPVVTGHTACYLDQTLHAVDTRTGASKWTTGADLRSPHLLGAGPGIFLAAGVDTPSGHSMLYALDAATGRKVWTMDVGAPATWSVLTHPGGVFVSGNAKLFDLRAGGG